MSSRRPARGLVEILYFHACSMCLTRLWHATSVQLARVILCVSIRCLVGECCWLAYTCCANYIKFHHRVRDLVS